MKTLSDKIAGEIKNGTILRTEDVKEFIKDLKFELDKQAYSNYDMDLLEIKATINELAGDKLI